MSDIAVKVENLGKSYQIGQAKSGDFRQSFGSWMDKLRGRNNGQVAESKEFWALKDINFEIKKGEAVGVIGRNGAGKSTLLKILSRITEPTRGRFEINGRVSSLLEVGTGFHPELSGRENIYLNGTILGMKRREIKAKFDEIVAFSGVEKFIDTPVKHYSSGMKVRLAFSVAAHLEPEILIIDEVLAVGDAEFQKKCLGKMDEVSKNEGRTVLFVSHNMGAVETLCHHGIVISQGSVCFHGSANMAISKYLMIRENSCSKLSSRKDRIGGEVFSFTEFNIIEKTTKQFISVPKTGDDLIFRINYRKCFKPLRNFVFDIGINNHFDTRVLWLSTEMISTNEIILGESDAGFIDIILDDLPLVPGRYFLTFFAKSNEEVIDWVSDAAILEVEGGKFYAAGKLPPAGHSNVLVKYSVNMSEKDQVQL